MIHPLRNSIDDPLSTRTFRFYLSHTSRIHLVYLSYFSYTPLIPVLYPFHTSSIPLPYPSYTPSIPLLYPFYTSLILPHPLILLSPLQHTLFKLHTRYTV